MFVCLWEETLQELLNGMTGRFGMHLDFVQPCRMHSGGCKRGVQHLPLRYEIVVVVVIVLLLAAPLLFVARRPQIGSIMVKMHEEEEEVVGPQAGTYPQDELHINIYKVFIYSQFFLELMIRYDCCLFT